MVLVYLGNTFFQGKSLFLFIFLFLRRGNGQTVTMEFNGSTRRTKEEIEIHEEFKWLFNSGNDDEIRILLIPSVSIKMVALYLKFMSQG